MDCTKKCGGKWKNEGQFLDPKKVDPKSERRNGVWNKN